MYKYFLYYLVAINILGIFINILDKYKAKHNKWRIPEATLWLICILGGSIGSYATMKTIRHKTKHKSFMIGIPAIIIIQIIISILVFIKI